MRAFAIRVLRFALFASASLPAQQPAPLVGVVIDEHGQAVREAMVVVSFSEGRAFACLDLELAHAWTEIARARTDRSGRFGLQLPVGLTLRIEVDHPGHAIWRRDDVSPGEELEIQLGTPCAFRGTLRLQGSGLGTPGRLRAWDANQTELFAGRTDAAGHFAFERLPAGSFTCDIEPDEAMGPAWFSGLLEAASPLLHDFDLEAGVLLQGTVTDAATRKPIAGARVGEGWTLHKAVVTGADGRYALRGHGQPGRSDVQCRADGFARAAASDLPAPVEDMTVDFALLRGVLVTGTIADADGKPCSNVYVAAVAFESTHHHWVPTRTAKDGTFTCDGFPANGAGALLLRRQGLATVVFNLPLAGRRGRIDVGTIALPAPQIVRGIVRDEDGRPVPGARVGLRGTNGDRQAFAPDPSNWGLLSMYVADRTVRTDAGGGFAFGDVAPGNYSLALGRGFEGKATQADFEVRGDSELPPFELVQR